MKLKEPYYVSTIGPSMSCPVAYADKAVALRIADHFRRAGGCFSVRVYDCSNDPSGVLIDGSEEN